MAIIKCKYCGEEFDGRDGQQFCSTKCRNAYNYLLRKHNGEISETEITEYEETSNGETLTDDETEMIVPDYNFTDREKKIIADILNRVADCLIFYNEQTVKYFCKNMVDNYPIPNVYKFAMHINSAIS